MSAQAFDYVIVGGGLTGCVVATRLAQALPNKTVAVIEAGPNEHHNPSVQNPMLGPTMHGGPLQYNYQTQPQQHLNDRRIPTFGGRLLSGSSAANYGAWTRGHAASFDAWAEHVGDARWSYNGLLPSFRKSEHWHLPDDGSGQHGYEGPIHTTGGGRGYPLRAPLLDCYKVLGLPNKADMNDGDPIGVSTAIENWRDAARQPAAAAYGMEAAGVKVLTEAVARRLVFDGTRVSGVELDSGTRVDAKEEVIVSCGAHRTPQLLMLSGIGPAKELQAHGISQLVELPVGQGLHDHTGVTMAHRLKEPEKGYAMGSPAFNKPEFMQGNPIDWFATMPAPDAEMEKALQKDGQPFKPGRRCDFELSILYLPFAPALGLAMDGTHITSGVICLSATSRGTVKLASTDPRVDPLIDPNFLATEHDRAVIRAAMRSSLKVMEEGERTGLLVANSETVGEGQAKLSSTSPDELLDARARESAAVYYHPGGTAAMGQVVDTECRVKGVQGLRVVDASILPSPLSGHYQAPMYAIAEQAASIIAAAA